MLNHISGKLFERQRLKEKETEFNFGTIRKKLFFLTTGDPVSTPMWLDTLAIGQIHPKVFSAHNIYFGKNWI